MSSISFIDIIILKAAALSEDPTQRRLIGLLPEFSGEVNSLMEKLGILRDGVMDVRYGRRLNSANTFNGSVGKWRSLGFIVQSDSYIVTPAGLDFLDEIGSDWRKYPLNIPIDDEASPELDLSNAKYIHDL